MKLQENIFSLEKQDVNMNAYNNMKKGLILSKKKRR